MNVFFTADLHLGHKNIIRYANRPFATVEENDEILISNWNSLIPKRNSLVYILGDFAWKDHNRYLSRLNGKKILITGSHDKMSQDDLKNFSEVYTGSRLINVHNKQFFISHCCHRVWEKGHYGIPHLFGHSHGRLTTYNLSADVGVDSTHIDENKYFPKSFQSILNFIENRTKLMREHKRIFIENSKEIFIQDDVNFLERRIINEF